jgi:hypothetical protein
VKDVSGEISCGTAGEVVGSGVIEASSLVREGGTSIADAALFVGLPVQSDAERRYNGLSVLTTPTTSISRSYGAIEVAVLEDGTGYDR